MTSSAFEITLEDIQENTTLSSSNVIGNTTSNFEITSEDVGLPTTATGVMPQSTSPSDYADSTGNKWYRVNS